MPSERRNLASLEFVRRDGRFRGQVPMGHLSRLVGDPAESMRASTQAFSAAVQEIAIWRKEAARHRKEGEAISARRAWLLGDIVLRLTTQLRNNGTRLEYMYEQLGKHAKTPARLDRYVSFRRHLESVDVIPEDLKWTKVADQPALNGRWIAAGNGMNVEP